MRRLKLIGIGAGNPEHITVQAIRALEQVDVVFLTDKGEEKAQLRRLREEICERYLRKRPHRLVTITDPPRDRSSADYRTAVADWHGQRVAIYERLLREELGEHECGAFLAWGDPALYDSTLRVIDAIAALKTVAFDWEVIPGITSIQALAASHRISWHAVGAPVHITTGRQLGTEPIGDDTSVLVLLDGQCAFQARATEDLDIFWGAYLGTPDEILITGRLSAVGDQIERARAAARERKGWIMDTYLLRKSSKQG
jgi:precorrin-6A synthase